MGASVRWIRLGLVTVAWGAGCSTDLSVEPTTLISCDTDADCPETFTCRASLGRCVTVGGDEDAPQISAVTVTPARVSRVSGRDVVTVSFVLDEDVGLTAPGLSVSVAGSVAACGRGAAGAIDCTYTVQASDVEGPTAIEIVATDGAGNVGRENADAFFDFTAPAVAFASRALLPAPGSPIPTVTMLPIDGQATVTATSTEALDTSVVPTLVAVHPTGTPTLAFSIAAGTFTESGATFEATGDAILADGIYALTVSWTDVAGNPGGGTLSSPTLPVKTSTPIARVDPAEVTYLRIPWGWPVPMTVGATTIAPGPYHGLAPGDVDSTSAALAPAAFQREDPDPGGGAPVLSAPVLVRVWADPARTLALGSLEPLDPPTDLRWPLAQLSSLDSAQAYASVIDPAGNESPAVPIPNTEVLVTLHPAPVGLPANPNSLLVSRYLRDLPAQDPKRSQIVGAEGPAPDGATVSAVGAPTWRSRRFWPEYPFTRHAPYQAYHPGRGTTVVFGGREMGGAVGFEDTWEWHDRVWTDRTGLEAAPPWRIFAASTYDSKRDRLVMFGGEGASAELNDLWMWDGARWAAAPAAAGPNERQGASMAYDPGRDRLVLFGGATAAGYNDETWEWDGQAWLQRMPSNSPGPRWKAGMAFDTTQNAIVLFGGGNPTRLDDTFLWDGVDWTGPLPVTAPAPSDEASMGRHRDGHVVMFNNDDDQLWSFAGRDWTPSSVTRVGLPPHVYDRDRDAWVGPRVGAYVLELADGEWNRIDVNDAPSYVSQTFLTGDQTNRVYMFGGGDYRGELWYWDGFRWREDVSTPSPTGRTGHGLAYDVMRDQLIVFGGSSGVMFPFTVIYEDDIFEFNGLTWSDATPMAGHPTSIMHHGMVYGNGTVYAIGASLGDVVWEWNGTAWAQHTPTGDGPAAREMFAIAFDSDRNRLITFGGTTPFPGNIVTGATWEWDPVSNVGVQYTGTSTPPPLVGARMVYEPSIARTVLFGGASSLSSAVRSNQTWTWDGLTWTDVSEAQPVIPGRYRHGMVLDAARGQVMVLNGAANALGHDQWYWDADPDRIPGAQLEAHLAPARVPNHDAITGLEIIMNCGAHFAPYGPGDTGATLYAWFIGDGPRNFGWVELPMAQNTAGPTAAPSDSRLHWEAPSPVEARRYVTALDLRVLAQCRPRGISGAPERSAELSVDYAEVRVRYTTP